MAASATMYVTVKATPKRIKPSGGPDLDQKIAFLAQHNVDSGAFVNCPMREATIAHQTPSMGLCSNNTKRGHNGRKAAKAQLGVTGGHVEYASAARPAQAARNARYGLSKHDKRTR